MSLGWDGLEEVNGEGEGDISNIFNNKELFWIFKNYIYHLVVSVRKKMLLFHLWYFLLSSQTKNLKVTHYTPPPFFKFQLNI